VGVEGGFTSTMKLCDDDQPPSFPALSFAFTLQYQVPSEREGVCHEVEEIHSLDFLFVVLKEEEVSTSTW
jgi:hypothetical protein